MGVTRADQASLPGQREGWRWWIRLGIVSLGMVLAVTAGALALGREPSDAFGLSISFTLAPVLIGVVSGRRRRRVREREVVGHLSSTRQKAALTTYTGLAQTVDPAVAHDAVGLILNVNGDVLGSSQTVGVVAIGAGAALAVLAALTSAWWAVDAAVCAALGIFLIRQTRRLRARLVALKAISARVRS